MSLDVNPEYIIITNDYDVNGQSLYDVAIGKNMTDVFQELADWKTQKGIPTKVVTVDDICFNYSGNDVQAKIHNFLTDVYQHYGTLFVLFGGDTNIVPARIIDTLAIQSWNSIQKFFPFYSDLYYTAVETSWDSNGNGIYCESIYASEYNDIIDKTPEFYYGRASAENVIEAITFVNKELVYEKLLSVNDKKYVNNIGAMVGYLLEEEIPGNNLNSNMNDMEDVFGKTIPVGKDGISQPNIIKWRSYDSNALQPSVLDYWMEFNKTNAVSCFSSSIPLSTMVQQRSHFTIHIDHSSYSSMGTSVLKNKQRVNRQEVDDFENAPYFQIVYSMGCYPGSFDKDCIAEHFLNNPQGGAVAMIASASICNPYEANSLKYLLVELYEHKRSNRYYDPIEYRIGPLFFHRGNNLPMMCKNHLFGDPELPIWTREPVNLTVSTSPSTITNQNGQLTVSVSGMAYSEYATNDVYVCVMKDGEVYLREHYDGTAHNHNFVFDVNPETAGTLKVTVTGHNYIPYETTVPVSITGKNVYISNKAVMDSSGNNDGNLDAGESVNLSISLKNNGTINLTNVNATLSCEFLDESLNQHINDYLTLNTSTVSFGSIAKNTEVTRNNYSMSLSNAIPDRTSLRCTLTISDGSGVIGTRSFMLSIGAPEIDYVSVRHETKPNGRIGLDIELNNLGFGTAKGVVATLTSSSGVQITQGTAIYGAMAHLEAKTKSFEFICNGSYNGKSFILSVTDAYNKSWSFTFVLHVITDTVENLTFESTEHSIKLKWDPVEGSGGYYVYRSTTSNGSYERLNSYPIPSSVYPDMGLGAKQTYYYGVSYLDEYGNESEKAHITAWTSLPIAEGWPVSIPDNLGIAWGTAPNVDDINGDGNQEIFLTTGTGDQPGNVGAILGFNSLGEELYDIDHNPTTVSGFANIGLSMTCTPAIGDIDNDGIMEIVVATRYGLNDSIHKLCVYKNRDVDNDGKPDFVWGDTLDNWNFNGVVLADLDDNGTLEIIAPNQGKKNDSTHVEVFDCYGHLLHNISIPFTYNVDRKAVTMPVVGDFDNDGHKEIVFGLEGGVYSWSCYTQQLSTLVPYDTNNMQRTDCPVIAVDIDGDGDKEILYMAIKNGIGYIRAINLDSTSVNGWNGNTHSVPLSNTDMDWAWPPYFSVGDIDNDGNVEVFAADNGVLKMWTSNGSTFGIGQIQIPNLDCRYFQPVIADVDGNGDCEIIIPSQNGYIYAYKTNGNAVLGWPLTVTELGTIPAITDLDGDGNNEVIAASKTEVYVWHTEGESKYNQCDRFRYNKYNNAVYEVPCSYVSTPLEISNVQIWYNDRQCNKDVVINNGARLIINSEVRFSSNAKVIVKPGGRLVIDGGTLTNSCSGEMWQGIEVWGNSSMHQYEVNGSYGQGYLELKNGAVIENAVCAVELWRPGYYSTTGGIIHATNATFRNNGIAVHALCYTNYDPGMDVRRSYNAYFKGCSFVTDNAYIGTTPFLRHVDLALVEGIDFFGCDFSVLRHAPGVSYSCSGIQANQASFNVNSYCTDETVLPCLDEYLLRSSFSGFHQGICAFNNGNTACVFNVRNSDFLNNDQGIYAQNTGYATILFNNFSIGCGAECTYGIYADNVTGFCIEENTFVPWNNSGCPAYGIAVINSHSTNAIYRNQFSGLVCANVAVGLNVGIANNAIPLTSTGLTYSCNDNTSGSANTIDFCVLRDGNVFYSGIQQAQGSMLLPAGNTFGGSQYHFYNEGNHTINYYYNQNQSDETPATSKISGVSLSGTSAANSCPSHYGNDVVRSPQEKEELASEYLAAHSAYNSLKQIYESRIDGGSTPTELSDITNATPSDMWELRAQLLGHSPYLSQTVLTAAADRDDVFTDPVLFEILSANPDELKKDTLISYLESKDNPLPEYMIEVLRQVANGATARTALEAQMAKYSHDFRLAAGDIVRSNLNDSVSNPVELRTWLAAMEDIAADRLAVASYMEEGNYPDAFTLANMLPDLYGLEGDALADHTDYMRLLSLYRTLGTSGRTVFEMTDDEIETVEGIADEGQGNSKSMAEALLVGIDDRSVTSFCPELPIPKRGDRSGNVNTGVLMNEAMGFTVSVSPSPATTWTKVDYTLPAGADKALLTLTSTLGVKVMDVELGGSQGSKVLDLRGLAAGVYAYSIRCGGHVETGKLVITK